MKKHLLFLAACFLFVFASAQAPAYSRVRIYTDDAGMARLAGAGIAIDHGEYKRGCCFTTDLSAAEFLEVQRLGFTYEVIVDDVQRFYQEQNTNLRNGPDPSTLAVNCAPATSIPTPSNFTLGSMAGFFTLAEIYWHLDNMATLYPNLVKARVATDSTMTTHEGRFVYWMKISDNPNADEAEPEMLYTAVHHAREPAGVSQLIMYMYYLLENYNTNPEIQYLLNNTELYFIPCINPDGYFHNETTNPAGGGMWRKNRRDNLDGTYGVDLNRNYGVNWGYDNIGSSPNTANDTYRGPVANSEPETQLIEGFCNAHQFRIAINYHTYSNVIVIPYGHAVGAYTPDSLLYYSWGEILTAENGYAFGTAIQTVGYTANGGSDDWMYGEQSTKPKIIAMTPEAGDQADGFWPAVNRIEPICKVNIPMNINAVRLLHAYGRATDTGPRYISQTSGYFYYDFQRLGLDSPAVYTVNIQPLSPYITSVGAGHSYSSLSLLQVVPDSVAYTLDANTPEGATLRFALEVSNGGFTWRDTITKVFGNYSVVFASNGSSMSGWTTVGGWNVTTSSYYSSPSSITDSPNGNYGQNASTRITTTLPIDLTTAISAQLSFRAKWELEAGFDYSQVQVSIDNGVSWTPVCGKYTTNNNNLDAGNPTFTGVQQNWVKEEMSLDNFLGNNILLRFRLRSDFGVEMDGFYFDDLLVQTIDTSTIGIAENHLASSIGQNMPNPADEYTFVNVNRPQENSVLEIYDSFGRLVMTENVTAGAANVRLNTATLPAGIYFYRLAYGNEASETRRMVITR
jgi:carboxypeptidase T